LILRALPRGNLGNGITVTNSSADIIGGSANEARNVISSNKYGISLGGNNVTVVGNFIGTAPDGLTKRSNTVTGVVVSGTSHVIGGLNAGELNVISGNTQAGVVITGTGNTVSGNYVGLGNDGTTAVGNGNTGVSLFSSVSNNIIGAAVATDPQGVIKTPANVIASNGGAGVSITDSNSNSVLGNFIGTDVGGMNARPNTGDGVVIATLLTQTTGNVVGGAQPGMRNVISGNGGNGVSITSPGMTRQTTNKQVLGNIIGLNKAIDKTKPLGTRRTAFSSTAGEQTTTRSRRAGSPTMAGRASRSFLRRGPGTPSVTRP
jgi:hypothetical protein